MAAPGPTSLCPWECWSTSEQRITPKLAETIYRSVGASGRGLLHFIGKNFKEDFSRWIRKRIFQGAYAPTLQEAMSILEPHHYSVLDVENLRLHYAKTVEHWLERFDRSSQQVSDLYGPWFQRAWRLYLAGSIAGFRAGSIQLFQIVFAGPSCQPIHWTRAPLYAGASSPEAHEQWTPAMS
jgi:cyclopropane-fatty-acyl-phospholipid synthase